MNFQKKQSFWLRVLGITIDMNNLKTSASSTFKVKFMLLYYVASTAFFLCKKEIESFEEKEVVFPRTTCLRPTLCTSAAQMGGRETPRLSNLLSCKI